MKKKVTIKRPAKQKPPKTADDWINRREKRKRLTIDIDESLHQRLKIASVKVGQSMGYIVRMCIADYLKEAEK